MVRKQVYIDEDLESSLKVISAQTGRPEAEHIRQALRDYVEKLRSELVADSEDPLLGLIGIVDDPSLPTDIALEHDHYLYGVSKKHGGRQEPKGRNKS